MRYFSLLIFSFFVIGSTACKSVKDTSEEKVLLKMDSVNKVASKIFLFKNKSMNIDSGNGYLSYKMENSEKTNVMQFVYERDMDQAVHDGGYREEVVFEVPNTISEQHYEDVGLQNTKMLFGRYCFCRGKTGLYKVIQGKLHVKSSKKETHFELQFKITEVPQVNEKISY